MSEMKWTPGPLLCDDDGFVFKDNALGTTVVLPGDYIRPEERKANARLIAAAPDLYAACEAQAAWAWAEEHPRTSTFDERMELSRYAGYLTAKALSKADGVEQEAAYSGVPHMIVWPEVGIQRADQQKAQAIVDRLIAEFRAARGEA